MNPLGQRLNVRGGRGGADLVLPSNSITRTLLGVAADAALPLLRGSPEEDEEDGPRSRRRCR